MRQKAKLRVGRALSLLPKKNRGHHWGDHQPQTENPRIAVPVLLVNWRADKGCVIQD